VKSHISSQLGRAQRGGRARRQQGRHRGTPRWVKPRIDRTGAGRGCSLAGLGLSVSRLRRDTSPVQRVPASASRAGPRRAGHRAAPTTSIDAPHRAALNVPRSAAGASNVHHRRKAISIRTSFQAGP